ncbi:MAG: hypothetical protein K2N31_05805 [Treponemataceae bacterium]|nr:hypothetical protein [Treponemataceae bacterium]
MSTASDRMLSETSDTSTATDETPSEVSDTLTTTDEMPSEVSDTSALKTVRVRTVSARKERLTAQP